MLVAVPLIGLSLLGAVVTPLWLIRENPGKTILCEDNDGAVPFVLFFVSSAGCGIMGCLLLPRAEFLALIAFAIAFPVPLQLMMRRHNRAVRSGQRP